MKTLTRVKTCLVGAAVLALLSGCSVLRNVDAGVNRDNSPYEEPQYFSSDPDVLIETLGEPDQLDQSNDDGKLRMIAKWNCVNGNSREVTWESRQGDALAEWVVIQDVSGDCIGAE